nr:hypothetical protein [uncultured bacterium]QLG20639.1 hypothetical protein [uncultured bacterium]QLG20653.1 hypothetical protein [uncultured bacterium]
MMKHAKGSIKARPRPAARRDTAGLHSQRAAAALRERRGLTSNGLVSR